MTQQEKREMASAPVLPAYPDPSRRNLLRAGLAGAAVLGATSQTVRAQSVPPAGGREPEFCDPLLELVNHVTQGFTEADFAEAQGMGYQGYLEFQLDYESIDDSGLNARLAPLTTLRMSGQELWENYGDRGGFEVSSELRFAAILRSVYTRRQLYERVVEFWTDHFNIFHGSGAQVELLKTIDDREVIRAHALGRFEDLLRASARSGAMSWYLDNRASSVGALNENYAREIMELHTVGREGGYHERDIVNLAKCFTGWGVRTGASGHFGAFGFYPERHDYSEKQVMDQYIAAGGGESDGETMIAYLANHPSTAEFISRKLISWLLGYRPHEHFVGEIAAVFATTSGDIMAVVRAIMQPGSLHKVSKTKRQKTRRPFHFVTSLMRATGAELSAQPGVKSFLKALGHVPFLWLPPDGYPDTAEAWGRNLMPRWDYAHQLLANQIPGVVVSDEAIVARFGGVPKNQLVARISEVLMGGAMSRRDHAEVQAYVDATPFLTRALVREAVAMAASSPSYQVY